MMTYQLIPFVDNKDIQLTANYTLENNKLVLSYILQGNLDLVELASFDKLQEGDDLWKTTCFECFCLLDDGHSYIELNFSPRGYWHIYYFDGYRKASKTLNHLITVNQIDTQFSHADKYRLNAAVNIESISIKAIGLTAVLEDKNNKLAYYALSHKASEPDFHQKASFEITL